MDQTAFQGGGLAYASEVGFIHHRIGGMISWSRIYKGL